MYRQQLTEASELIRAERYDEARALLQTIDHEIARSWLAKLDQIAPETPQTATHRRSGLPLLLVAVVLVVALVRIGILVMSRVLPGTAASSITPSTTELARYFPADTILYASVRLDTPMLDAIDDLISQLGNQIATYAFNVPALATPITLSSQLDFIAKGTFNVDFENAIRPWLGENIAVGVWEASIPTAGLIAVEITDRARATAFVEGMLPRFGSFTRTEESDYTVFAAGDRDSIAVGENMLFFTSQKVLLPLATLPNPSLADSPAFNGALALLTLRDYDVLAYGDIPESLRSMAEAIGEGAANPEMVFVNDTIGPSVFGAALVDGRSLVLDFAQKIDDREALKAAGLIFDGPGPVDLDFLARVPPDASMVAIGTNLKTNFDGVLGMMKASLARQRTDPAQIDQLLGQFRLMSQFMLGFSVIDDFFALFTGELAGYITYAPPSPGELPYSVAALFGETAPLNMETVTIAEVSDPAKAQEVIDKLAAAVTRLAGSTGATVTQEQIAGTDAWVISVPEEGLATPLETVLAVKDGLMVWGTRSGTTAVLSGAGGFNTSAGFGEARRYLLENPTWVWYADANLINLYGDAFAAAVPAMNAMFGDLAAALDNQPTPTPPDLTQMRAQITEAQTQVRAIAAMFHSMTISTASNANGDAKIRLVITLAE